MPWQWLETMRQCLTGKPLSWNSLKSSNSMQFHSSISLLSAPASSHHLRMRCHRLVQLLMSHYFPCSLHLHCHCLDLLSSSSSSSYSYFLLRLLLWFCLLRPSCIDQARSNLLFYPFFTGLCLSSYVTLLTCEFEKASLFIGHYTPESYAQKEFVLTLRQDPPPLRLF